MKSGALGGIAVAFMEWGGPQSQVLIVDWHVVRDEASARLFADKLVMAPRGATGYNSISNAIDFSVNLAESNNHEGTRKVIDVSGDGPNMNGRSLAAARSDALAKGFTINALSIRDPAAGRADRAEWAWRITMRRTSSAVPALSWKSPTKRGHLLLRPAANS